VAGADTDHVKVSQGEIV